MNLITTALRPLLALAACAAPLCAQTPYVFGINQSASNFTWSGTTTVGAIVGNPSNAFQFAGTTQIDLVAAPSAVLTQGQFTGGDAFTVPNIHGRIPNPLLFPPNLATIDVVGLHVTASSPAFVIGGGGACTATLTLTATAGTMTVTPLGGSATNTPLAGSSSAPTVVSGTLQRVGTNLRLVLPISTTFPFSDPTSGVSGSITLNGTLDATYGLFGTVCSGDGSSGPCPCGNTGSTGHGCANSFFPSGALLSPSGLASVSADTLLLTATNLSGNLALFVQSPGLSAPAALDDGLFCLGTTILRLRNKAVGGGAALYPEAGDQSVSVRGLIPATGGTYYYQTYYRNASTTYCTPATSNRTNGVRVTWLP